MNLAAVYSAIRGLAAGDALGATSEFQTPPAVAATYASYEKLGWPFTPVGGGPFRWRPGQPTDDAQQALILIYSHMECGGFNADHFSNCLVGWLDGNPPDVGTTTRAALSASRGGLWYAASQRAYRNRLARGANGALMRNGVVMALEDTLHAAFRTSLLQGIVTHFHPESVLACAVQTWHLWNIHKGTFHAMDWEDEFHGDWSAWLEKEEDPFVKSWLADVEADGSLDKTLPAFLEFDYASYNPFMGTGGGCARETLAVALWAAQWCVVSEDEPSMVPELGEYGKAMPWLAELVKTRRGADVLGWVALLGDDSDTYGAAAGPLVAAIKGGVLPPAMLENLEAVDQFSKFAPAKTDSLKLSK
jgi:ADP-ribosylglycohydrolase